MANKLEIFATHPDADSVDIPDLVKALLRARFTSVSVEIEIGESVLQRTWDAAPQQTEVPETSEDGVDEE